MDRRSKLLIAILIVVVLTFSIVGATVNKQYEEQKDFLQSRVVSEQQKRQGLLAEKRNAQVIEERLRQQMILNAEKERKLAALKKLEELRAVATRDAQKTTTTTSTPTTVTTTTTSTPTTVTTPKTTTTQKKTTPVIKHVVKKTTPKTKTS